MDLSSQFGQMDDKVRKRLFSYIVPDPPIPSLIRPTVNFLVAPVLGQILSGLNALLIPRSLDTSPHIRLVI